MEIEPIFSLDFEREDENEKNLIRCVGFMISMWAF